MQLSKYHSKQKMAIIHPPSVLSDLIDRWKLQLHEAGIENWHLLDKSRLSITEKLHSNAISYFPLEWFDAGGKPFSHSTHGIAFLPNITPAEQHERPTYSLNELYDWFVVEAVAHDSANRRWSIRIRTKKTTQFFDVPELFLYHDMSSSSAKTHIARLRWALTQRRQSEQSFRMATLLDCLNLWGLPSPSAAMQERVWRKALSGAQLTASQRAPLAKLFHMDYLCVMAMLEIERYYDKSDLFGSFAFSVPLYLRPSQPACQPVVVDDNRRNRFQSTIRTFKQNTLFNHIEIVCALHDLLLENEAMAKVSLFAVSRCGHETLCDFEKSQKTTTLLAINYLRGMWAPKWTAVVAAAMRNCGAGDFDAQLSDWSIYRRTKGWRLLRHIRCRMETSVRQLVMDSVGAYTDFMCAPCAICLSRAATTEFAWTDNNLIDSPFVPAGGADAYIFQVTFDMNNAGGYFHTNPDAFAAFAVALMNDAIEQSHHIDIIDPLVMTRLKYPGNLRLSSLGVNSNVAIVCRERLQQSFAAAVIPLKAYAKRYDQFIEAEVLDVDEYMATVAAIPRTSQELRELIVHCIGWRDRLQISLPDSIIIGPFKVLVGGVRNRLVAKYEQLRQLLLAYLAHKLTIETQTIVVRYTDMIDRLRRRPTSIDDITATTEWMMHELQPQIATLEHMNKIKSYEYEMIDDFWHALTDTEAIVKWTAVIYPYRIRQQLEPTLATFEVCREQFAKQQTTDVIAFDEQTEVLNGAVFMLAGQADVMRAAEYAVEATRLWNAVQEAHRHGAIMNGRQTLFNRPAIDVIVLQKLEATLMPFRMLWTAAGDYFKLRDTTLGNPMHIVEVVDVRAGIERIRRQLIECGDDFAELVNVDTARNYFLHELNDFEGVVDVMGNVKSPDWLHIHWLELCRLAAIDVKPNAAMTFATCIGRGILEHRDLVRRITAQATEQRHELEEQRRRDEDALRADEEARWKYKQNRRGRKLD